MSSPNRSNKKVHVLFSEGSSTNAREMITALGPLGYTIDLCDPRPICLGRFSRYVRRVYRCPVSGRDPVGYLDFVIRLLKSQSYEVLFPANEQAYLFAWIKDRLSPLTGLAVAEFSAFNRLQTKTAFMRLLDELGLPHPESRVVHTWQEIEEAADTFALPFYLKTSYGTASTGVWRVESNQALSNLRAYLESHNLLAGETEFLAQAAAPGFFEQSHAIFDQGRLLALRCTRRLMEGAQGGAAVKIGVERAPVREDFEIIGGALSWHGSLSIDYFWDERGERPAYIDANPRISEPMNAAFNGINFADLQVRLSLEEDLGPFPDGTASVKSHNLVQVMLGAAGKGQSRRAVIRAILSVLLKKGVFRDSRECMLPVSKDPLSILPLAFVFLRLMMDPGSKQRLSLDTISNYSLDAVIPRLAAMAADFPG